MTAKTDLEAYQSQITEAMVLRDCLNLLLSLGFLVIRVNQGSVTQPATKTRGRRFVRFATWQAGGYPSQSAGVSDILAIAPGGQLWAVEVKRPGKLENVTKAQRDFLGAARAAGAAAVVVDGVERLRAEIERQGRL